MDEQDGLAVVLSEFARTLVTDFPIQGILDHLVKRIVDILPIHAAGVSLISATTKPRLIAGSDDSAVRYEHLQTTLGEGPCIEAYQTDLSVSMPDLLHDDRFPRFTSRALREGLAAAFTFPLRNEGRTLGALDLYRTTPGDLGPRDMTTAQTLADVATAYLLNAEARMARNDFVAMVSHELRTPMTNIAGYVEFLEDCIEGPLTPGQVRFVDAIERNSQRLRALVDDLLTVSTLEGSVADHPHGVLDLGEVVRSARRTLEPQLEKVLRTVTFTVPDEPVPVVGDPADLEMMVLNLLSNALKFTSDGGWVRCELSRVGSSARLEVSDNGLGIPQSEQRDLFTRFFRASTAQERAIQGTGLGLTIVQMIVEQHDGDVSVASAHLEGAVFTVNLPIALSTHLPAPQHDGCGETAGVRPPE